MHPGKLWAGTCNYGWGGISRYAREYEVLLDRGYHWETATVFGLPSNAIDGGPAGNAAGNVRLGVCEAFDGGDSTWHPGKFYAGKCNYAWGGSEGDSFGDALTALPNGNVRILVR